MKAIRVHNWGGPEELKLEDVPDPQPGPGQVVVRVRAAGVNPVDTYVRSGNYGKDRPLPYTPGSDVAGDVESVGTGVTRWKPGDRVYTEGTLSGAYAEKALCDQGQLHPLPQNVSYSQGAGLGVPYGTAYRALFQRAQAKAGETVLVHGASGGVGTAAVQFARAFGMTVIGTAGTEEGRKLVADQGADYVLDHDAPDHLQKALDLTGGQGVNLILEMLANVNLGRDLPTLARNGRVIVIGSRGSVEIDPRDTMGKESDIRGMTLMAATPEELKGIHAAIVAGLENGTLKPIVGEEFPLAEAARSHERVMESGHQGKIVLVTG